MAGSSIHKNVSIDFLNSQLNAVRKRVPRHPSEARKLMAETGLTLKERLTRATLRHLRPGPEMELALDAGGDPSIHTKREKGQEMQPASILPTSYQQGCPHVD
jgi:hypothetical protein